jgi:hypothetical protein
MLYMFEEIGSISKGERQSCSMEGVLHEKPYEWGSSKNP